MATGITNGFPFRPTLRSSRSIGTKTTLYSVQLDSKQLFGLRLKSVVTSDCLPSSPSVLRITARFGGGGGPRPGSYGGGGGGPRRSSQQQKKPSDNDDAPELNISSIKSSTVRLIDEEQNMVGVVAMNQALQMAEDAELDLVILSPDADPPVVRIMDYNKYTYELQKKKREQQKKSVANRMDLKELKMGYNIDSHDYSVRLKAAQKFLKDGDKVKVIVNLKGRENQFRNIAIDLIRRFQADVGELATEESKSFNDRNINIVLVPNKAVQKPPDTPKKKEKPATTEVSAGV